MTGQYPKDEFDDIPAGGPVGVHRKPQSPWGAVMPFLIVLLLVPLLAWGVTSLVRSKVVDRDTEFAGEQQSVASVESDLEEVASFSETDDIPTAAPDNPAEEPRVNLLETVNNFDVEGEVLYEAEISVLNATGTQGLAGGKVEQLASAGFTNASADNSSDTLTPQNTVYYSGADMAATAQEVGNILGISTLVEDSVVTGGPGIVVLLRN